MHEPEHILRAAVGPFVKPAPADARTHPGASTTLPAMHPPPFLPSRRAAATAALELPRRDEEDAPAAPVEAAPDAAPGESVMQPPLELSTEAVGSEEGETAAASAEPAASTAGDASGTVEWIDAMPEPGPDPDAVTGAFYQADVDDGRIEAATSAGGQRDAAALLRALADRIDAGQLEVAPSRSAQSDAALLTAVLAALLSAPAAGERSGDSASAGAA